MSDSKQLVIIIDGFFKGSLNYEQNKDVLIIKSVEDIQNWVTKCNTFIPCKDMNSFRHSSGQLLIKFIADNRLRDDVNKILVDGLGPLNKYINESKYMKAMFRVYKFIYNEEQYVWVKPDEMKPENQHSNLLNAALHTFKLSEGLHNLYTREGIITCGRAAFDSLKDTFIIYYIYVKPELRGQRKWSNVLRGLAKHDKINKICVCAVSNHKMNDIMTKFELNGVKFDNIGGDFVWIKNQTK